MPGDLIWLEGVCDAAHPAEFCRRPFGIELDGVPYLVATDSRIAVALRGETAEAVTGIQAGVARTRLQGWFAEPAPSDAVQTTTEALAAFCGAPGKVFGEVCECCEFDEEPCEGKHWIVRRGEILGHPVNRWLAALPFTYLVPGPVKLWLNLLRTGTPGGEPVYPRFQLIHEEWRMLWMAMRHEGGPQDREMPRFEA